MFSLNRCLLPLASTLIAVAPAAYAEDPPVADHLTGSVTIDSGRHVIPRLQPAILGTLTLDGGNMTAATETEVSIHQGGFAQFQNGLLLTSLSDFTFDGSNQTHDLQVGYNGPVGSYSIENFQLPAANDYLDAAGETRHELGGSWRLQAEYGNVFGEKRTFSIRSTENVNWGFRKRPEQSYYYQSDPNHNTLRTDDLVETPQLQAPKTYLSSSTATQPAGTWELARGAGVLLNERANALMTAAPVPPSDPENEPFPEAQLDLSGIAVSISGTALYDRRISGGTISLGRVMVGSGSVNVNSADTVDLTTSGGDDTRTRIRLGQFDVEDSEAGIRVVHQGSADFADGDAASTVALTGQFSLTAETLGRHTKFIDVGSNISTLENGGAGLAGENTQDVLNIGYAWNVVDNNNLVSGDLLIFEWAGKEGGRSHANFSVDYEHGSRSWGSSTHTNIGFDDRVQLNGTYAAGQHNLGTTTLNVANGKVWGEGLEGEDVIAETSFQTTLVAIDEAAYEIAASNEGPLTTGDTITIKDIGQGIYQAHTEVSRVNMTGGDKLDYEVSYTGDVTIDHGAESVVTIQYTGDVIEPEAGELGQVKRANFEVLIGQYADLSPFSGIERSDTSYDLWSSTIGRHQFDLETRFDAPASETASAEVTSGTNFRETGLSLANTAENTGSRFSTATSFEILDSHNLDENKTVTVSFTSVDALDAVTRDALESDTSNEASRAGLFNGGEGGALSFSSDIVSLDGLDGLFQVIELSVNDTMPGAHQVVWETTYLDSGEMQQTAWVNAVLGNSNITGLDLLGGTLTIGEQEHAIGDYLEDLFFLGSYGSYLRSDDVNGTAALGAWGFDPDRLQAWAVIDHNSNFATAIPEPGTCALILGLAGLGGVFARRRRRASIAALSRNG